MPTQGPSRSFFPRRLPWLRPAQPALANLATTPPAPRPYVGTPRTGTGGGFVLSTLTLSLDQLLFLITSALLCFGLLMVQSADQRIRPLAPGHDNTLLQNLANKNILHAALAILTMTLIWRLDYRLLLGRRKKDNAGLPTDRTLLQLLFLPSTLLLILTAAFLAAVLATPFGKEINGARRWFAIGSFGFQPSELAKLSLVLFVAAFAAHRQGAIRSFHRGFLPLIVLFAGIAALVMKEDFGTTLLISAVVLLMILMAGCRPWHLALLLPGLGYVIYHMLHTPFRMARLMAFLHPELDPKGAGYHPMQSLLTIISGGPWGRGLGNGIQKMGYLPEDNTDFIFAVICEELGFIGAAIVIALFAAFVLVGWRVMSRCNSLFGKMVAFGITAVIGLQAAINIAVVTVSMPTKGIALPLISSGGTGWIMNAAAIGVLMSIERVTRKEQEAAQHTRAEQGFPIELHTTPIVATPGPNIANAAH